MIALVPIALFGWIPAILILFGMLPPRRAVIVAFIFAWLFLPYAGYELPGLPDYTKRSATSLGVLLGTVIFHNDRLLSVRPRWYDLPMAIYCLCPIASSVSNGLGLYDGCSSSFDYFVSWGLPYLIGRIYFTRLEHLRDLAIGIVTGGMVYVPFALWEMKMSPQLHMYVYGFMARGWGEVVNGFYRPQVFMSCALEFGLWMTATATTAFWLWASGSVKQIGNYPLGWVSFSLIAIVVFCMVTGSWVILILGISLWALLKWSNSRLPAVLLILLPVLYLTSRVSGLWSGATAVNVIRTVVSDRRAESLGFRMKNEDLLAHKALQQPMFGWGGWGRAFVYEDGRAVTIVDGMWIIILGNNGLVGLVSFEAALLLPMVLLVRRYPARAWRTPTLAPAAVLATLANLYAVDCIANAMLNPIYILALGGLTETLGALDRRGVPGDIEPNVADLSQLLDHMDNENGFLTNATSGGREPDTSSDPRVEAAIRYGSLGRSLLEHGMVRESKEAWFSALQTWAGLVADYPNDPEHRNCWLDSLNDCAWTLVTHPDFEEHDIATAIQLAEQTVVLEPESATYWNTLGIAYFRAHDWKAAIHALKQSTEFSDGGTSFDYFVLAMAEWQQGDQTESRHWYSRGNAWMEEHHPDHEVLRRFRQEARMMLESRPVVA